MSEPSTPTARAGAIHDIGYRHYDGARLGASYIRRSLFVETLRGAYGLGRSARSMGVHRNTLRNKVSNLGIATEDLDRRSRRRPRRRPKPTG